MRRFRHFWVGPTSRVAAFLAASALTRARIRPAAQLVRAWLSATPARRTTPDGDEPRPGRG